MNQTLPSHSSSYKMEHSHHQKHSSRTTTLLASTSDLRDIDTKVNDWKLPDPHHPSCSIDHNYECHAHSPLVHEFNEKKTTAATTNGGCSPCAQQKERCEALDERHEDGRGLPALPSPILVSSSISRSRACPHHWRHEQLRESFENPMEVKENSGKSPYRSRCKRGFSSNNKYSQLHYPLKLWDKVATSIYLSVLLQLRRLSRAFNAGNATLVSLESHKREWRTSQSLVSWLYYLQALCIDVCLPSRRNFNIRNLNQKSRVRSVETAGNIQEIDRINRGPIFSQIKSLVVRAFMNGGGRQTCCR